MSLECSFSTPLKLIRKALAHGTENSFSVCAPIVILDKSTTAMNAAKVETYLINVIRIFIFWSVTSDVSLFRFYTKIEEGKVDLLPPNGKRFFGANNLSGANANMPNDSASILKSAKCAA